MGVTQVQRLVSRGIQASIEPATGMLREVTAGGIELLRGAYTAVRADDWKTAQNTVTRFDATQDKASWTMVSEDGDRKVEWTGSLEVRPNGITYRVEGVAQTSFSTRRTGLVVLHPPSQAGTVCIIQNPDGSRLKGEFPQHISPHQPFRNIRRMDVVLPEGCLRIDFAGEVFETEDQRNWSDASYKTYCRPLDWPSPYRLEKGDRIVHEVSLEWGPPALPITEREELGSLGLMLGSGAIADWQIERLREMRLGHLGIEADIEGGIEAAAQVAERLGVPIHLHANGTPKPVSAEWLGSHRPELVVLGLGTNPSPWRELTSAPLILASRHNFTELNRAAPDPSLWDGLGFSTNPQVHAFDETSIMQTVETMRLLATEARILALGKPICVAPILWQSRGEDPRLRSPIAAAWLMGVLAQVLPVAAWATALRTHGPGGVLPASDGDPLPVETALRYLGELGSQAQASVRRDVAILTCQKFQILANLTGEERQALGRTLAPYQVARQ